MISITNKSKIKIGMVITSMTILTSCTNTNDMNISQNNSNSITTYQYREDESKVGIDPDKHLEKMKQEYLSKMLEENYGNIYENDEILKQEFGDQVERLEELPSELSYYMSKELYEITSEVTSKYEDKIPMWVPLGLLGTNESPYYSINPPLPSTSIPTIHYNEKDPIPLNDDKKDNILNFRSYSERHIQKGLGDRTSPKNDIKASSIKGPMGINIDKINPWKLSEKNRLKYENNEADYHNLLVSMEIALDSIHYNYKFINDLMPHLTKENKWLFAVMAYETSINDILKQVPSDTLNEFIEKDLGKIIESNSTQNKMYVTYINSLANDLDTKEESEETINVNSKNTNNVKERDEKIQEIFYSYLNNNNYIFPKSKQNALTEKYKLENMTLLNDNELSIYPADQTGNRLSDTTNPNLVEKVETSVIAKYNNKNRIILNEERYKNTILIYSLGKNIQKELQYRIEQGLDMNKNSQFQSTNLTGKTGTYYHWEQSPIGENMSQQQKKQTVGKISEVGWKGNFPVFVQESNSPGQSSIPWKYQGSNTTLGVSGCSLYTMTSLIHGAGLGDQYIPNTNKLPTLENLAKEFPNGPLISTHLESKGYKVKTMSTNTKSDLNKLFEEVSSGIPYAVNVKYGNIKAKTYSGKNVSTRFTNGGHFILLVGGHTDKGKRYVDVVQSTYGNASTLGEDSDQNRMSFDFDHLVENNIIRASSGYAVPAYTITGIQNTNIPITYLNSNYVSPGPTNHKIKIDMSNLPNIISPKLSNTINKAIDKLPTLSSLNKEKEQSKLREIQSIKDNPKPTTSEIIKREEIRKNIQNKKDNKLMNTISKNKINENEIRAKLELKNNETTVVKFDGNNMIIYLDYINGIMLTNIETDLIYDGVVKKNTTIGTTTNNTKIYPMLRDPIKDKWYKSEDIIDL